MDSTNDPLAPPPAPPTPPLTPSPTSMGDLPPAPPAATQPLPQPVIPPAPEVTQSAGDTGSKKPMMIALIVALVIAILGVGGFYAYTIMGTPKDVETEQTKESPDTSSQDIKNLGAEVQDIELADPETALMEIDKEITALDATPAASVKPSASVKATPTPKASASPKATATPKASSATTTIDR